jgi:DNA-binding XRE family transcriptional regulator
VELGKQIKQHREARGLSQDDLARKIYVSRQTISNWETDRTCPDIQSLLLMSTLFDVTIDDMVRGDIEMIQKKATDAKKMSRWGWIMNAGIVAGALLIAPCVNYWGIAGVILPLGLLAVATVASIMVERYKKRNNVQTFSEIAAFVDGSPRNEEKIAREREHWKLKRVLMAFVAAVIGAMLAATGIWFTLL